jgi:polyribonucleotide nucleotidyltransferase
MEYTFKADVGGKTLSIQAGKVAKQASGSVVVQYGDTMVLVTAVSANSERDIDFLPLSVEYQEKGLCCRTHPWKLLSTGDRSTQREGNPHRPPD